MHRSIMAVSMKPAALSAQKLATWWPPPWRMRRSDLSYENHGTSHEIG